MAGEPLNKSKLAGLRKGTPMHKNVTLGSGEQSVDVVVVLLSSDDTLEIEQATEEYCKSIGDKNNRTVRNNYYNQLLCSMCMRDPSDPTYKTGMVDSVDEVGQFMDIEDIDRIVEAYKELLMNKAPKVELLTEEELEELKNYLGVTPLNDLSTVLQINLKSCHQIYLSEK